MMPDDMFESDLQIDTELLESDLVSIDQVLPTKLYIIPIRYRPIFPGIITPLIISNGRFSDVIDKSFTTPEPIGLVLIKDDNKDEISAATCTTSAPRPRY